MERKIVFLDIDGVLQPLGSQERFEHIKYNDFENSDIPKLYRHLEWKHQIDFSKYNQYDVAAVYYDWNKTSVSLLRLLLKITGAQIVLSSDWRMEGFDRMKDFFTIYGLETYYIENTEDYQKIDKDFIEKQEKQNKEIYGEKAYLTHRSVEILEWLHRNSDVKKWVAIDDLKLTGIDSNFVRTEHYFTDDHAEKCFRILTGTQE